jgi:hypothetical protein
VDTFGIITTVAGGGSNLSDGVPATSAELEFPCGVVFDTSGNMYVTEQTGARVRKVNTSGYISTMAGTGLKGYSGDNGPATNAELDGPYGIGLDKTGNIYITDVANGTIRKVDNSGIITTIAGTGTQGFNGDGIAATTAELASPESVFADDAGNIFIADGWNDRAREINTNGIISTVVSDTGKITIPNLEFVSSFGKDSCGSWYVIDADWSNIWKVTNPPDTEENISPQSPLVCDGQGISLVATGSGTTYAWSPATGLSATTGDSVVAAPTATTTYIVTSSSSGCVFTSKDVITVTTAPPLTVQPPSPFLCAGQTVTLTAPSGSGYVWSPSTSLSSSTGDSVVATPLVTTTYTITGTDSLGCPATGLDVVTVLPSPNKPSFTQHNDTLISSSKHDNQWYRNDTLLKNDTSQYLIITALGQYYVSVLNEVNGCSTTSDTVNISSLTGIGKLSINNNQLTIYPNPTSNQLTVESGQLTINEITITNVLGEPVYKKSTARPHANTNPSLTIDVSYLSDGLYFITATTNTGTVTEKFIVSR